MRAAIVVALAAAAALPGRAAADGAAYRSEVKKFRTDREARLKSEDGWLSVSGLFWLREGRNTFGSAPANDIVLPASAPAEAGHFDLSGGRVSVTLAPGTGAVVDGKPAREAPMKADETKLVMGRLTLLVHASGSRLGIRLKDKDSALRRNFKGLSWFPIDPRWRVVAPWKSYAQPKSVEVQNVMGDVDDEPVPGCAQLTLGGKEYCLEPEQDDDGSLEFVFRDGTSGKETYAAARFVDAQPPKDGKVVLDFNEAYNPPCAFNKYTTCPLPGPSNRIAARIPAGEKKYRGHH